MAQCDGITSCSTPRLDENITEPSLLAFTYLPTTSYTTELRHLEQVLHILQSLQKQADNMPKHTRTHTNSIHMAQELQLLSILQAGE